MLKTNKCCKTSGYSMDVMTYLLQNWNYSGERRGTIKRICPWGMKDTMTSLLSDKKCKNKSVLPSIIKGHIADKPYNKDLVTISVTNTGPHATNFLAKHVNQILSC